MNNNVTLLIGRILLSAMFIMAGLTKLPDISQTAGMIANAGLPAPAILGYLAAIFEIATGLCILIGFQTKIAAYLLALFCLFTAFVFHNGPINVPDFPEQANGMLSMFNFLMMLKNITIAGGFLVLAAAGPGSYSVDARRA